MVFTITSATINPSAAFATVGSGRITIRGRAARQLLRRAPVQRAPVGRLLVRRPRSQRHRHLAGHRVHPADGQPGSAGQLGHLRVRGVWPLKEVSVPHSETSDGSRPGARPGAISFCPRRLPASAIAKWFLAGGTEAGMLV
jgi:hypothetical protein